MNLYDALHRVKKAAKPLAGGTIITPETGAQKLSELGELLDAIRQAKEAGAAPHNIVEAVLGDVPMYLKD